MFLVLALDVQGSIAGVLDGVCINILSVITGFSVRISAGTLMELLHTLFLRIIFVMLPIMN